MTQHFAQMNRHVLWTAWNFKILLTNTVLDSAVKRVYNRCPTVSDPVRFVDGLSQFRKAVVRTKLGQVEHRRVIVFVVDFKLEQNDFNRSRIHALYNRLETYNFNS